MPIWSVSSYCYPVVVFVSYTVYGARLIKTTRRLNRVQARRRIVDINRRTPVRTIRIHTMYIIYMCMYNVKTVRVIYIIYYTTCL